MSLEPLHLACVAVALLSSFGPHPTPAARTDAAQDTPALRFETRDLVVDPRGAPLAAWQVRLVAPSGNVRVVGVEGGTAPAFQAPPHYDPRALAGGELVLAAYDTTGGGPTTPTTVARIHLAVSGDTAPAFQLVLDVAASPAGPILGATSALVP